MVHQNYLHTLVRDCLAIIMSDGEIEPKELEKLESHLNSFTDGESPKPLISYIANNFNNIEDYYPVEQDSKILHIDIVYRVLVSATEIHSDAIELFQEIALKLSLDSVIVSDYLNDVSNHLLKQSSGNDLNRLVDLVEKKTNSEYGVFSNIMDDLGIFIQNVGHDVDEMTDEEKLTTMAYAYARRSVAAGLVAQGLWGKEEFAHQVKVFQAFQINTIHTREFQESANEQAQELLSSYDKRLTPSLISSLLIPLVQTDLDSVQLPKELGIYHSVDDLVEMFG